MKYLITIEHPAWANQYNLIIKRLLREGHQVKVLLINQEVTENLLQSFCIKYTKIANSTGGNLLSMGWIFLVTTIKILIESLKFKPQIYIGRSSPMVALVAYLLSKPHVIFEDTERAFISLWFCRRFSKQIITPSNFAVEKVGEKIHDPVEGFKELFYLHPNIFKPDSSVLDVLGVKKGEKFILLRYIAWTAHHDLGQKGFTDKFRLKIAKELSEKYKVFISSETPLQGELAKYALKTPSNKIHSVLHYAHAFFSESGTMSAESAIIGTPVIYVSTLAKHMGYIKDLCYKYNLLFYFDDEQDGYDKLNELLQNENLAEEWKENRVHFLSQIIDMNEYYYDQITGKSRFVDLN